MNAIHHQNGMEKNIFILMVLAIFNALAVVVLIAGFVVLFKQNPILCFRHSCTNDSYPFQVKSLSVEVPNDSFISDPIVQPVTVKDKPVISIKSNAAAVDDFTEKEYIQSLVTSYKKENINKFSAITQDEQSQSDQINSDHKKAEQAYSHMQQCIFSPMNCNQQEFHLTLDQKEKIFNDDLVQITFTKQQIISLDQKISLTVQENKKILSNSFCLSSQIPTKYKDYCLSLF